MNRHPNLTIKGGDSLTNPYKIPYELALADKREALEKYKNSSKSLFSLSRQFYGPQGIHHGISR